LPKESKPKAVSNKNKQLSKFSSFSHGIRVQMLLERSSSHHFLAHLACRRRGRAGSCLAVWLILDEKHGHYLRGCSADMLREVNIDNHTGYRTILEDVYISQPLPGFGYQHVPYQLEDLFDVHNLEFLLFLEDASARQAGFTSITYIPDVISLCSTFRMIFSSY